MPYSHCIASGSKLSVCLLHIQGVTFSTIKTGKLELFSSILYFDNLLDFGKARRQYREQERFKSVVSEFVMNSVEKQE